MQVTVAQEDIRNPSANITNVSSVVVKDRYGNPVMAAMEMPSDEGNPSVVMTLTKADPDFDAMLEKLGFTARYTP